MMMDRRHGENAFAGGLETDHLQNHRDGFDDENAANHNEQQLLLATNRHHSNYPANGERAGVAHENLCRMTVEPERSEEHTSELQSRFGISYAVFCLKK